ncbi:hypothetical protein [Paenibacillus sp. FSL R10-2736]|uniref:hypothetical protein n=1 Tax=Paenibacillus sp. FSL R10-2736 TaxID=2954692 RepID=UPI0030FAD8DC
MNRLILRRMALSTLLLSSIATPVFADADRTPPQARNAAVTLSAASAPLPGSILITARIPDLLDLAERYAPETVQDWTDTLSRYNKALRLNVQVLTLDTTGEVTAPAVQLATPVALTAAALPSLAGSAPAADLQLAGTDGTLRAFATGTAASSTADFTVFAAPDSLSSDGLTDSIAITAAAAPALLPMTEDNGFLNAQAALAEAVESKDATAVKHALGGLLEQYKDLTKKLEEAK